MEHQVSFECYNPEVKQYLLAHNYPSLIEVGNIIIDSTIYYLWYNLYAIIVIDVPLFHFHRLSSLGWLWWCLVIHGSLFKADSMSSKSKVDNCTLNGRWLADCPPRPAGYHQAYTAPDVHRWGGCGNSINNNYRFSMLTWTPPCPRLLNEHSVPYMTVDLAGLHWSYLRL